ncbi:MAG: aldehyde dehydrogenase family protein [Lysobacter sp.]|nr:aldehyde dehydrogenase family protein [Lysobacter sp.]
MPSVNASGTLKVLRPYDQSLICEIPMDSHEAVMAALGRAHQLAEDPSRWLASYQRIEILERAVALMQERVESLTQTALHEGGKPYSDSKVEVLRAIAGVKIAAETISHLGGEQVPMGLTEATQNRIAFTTREPVGVVVSISAFNHPLNLVVHQTVTAFAAGCPVVIKPANTTPLSCLAFVELLKEAGIPDDWCQAVVCDNEAAEQLATDPRVGFLSFIGSAKVGWYLRSKLAPGTRCALEHGGAAPVIVDKSADYATMIPLLVKGGFYHAGQVCVSVQRIFVHQDDCDAISKALVVQVNNLQVGDPANEQTEVGPLILPREVDRVESWVNEALTMGGKLLCGGKRISDTCFQPTVILDPSDTAKVSTEEIFGPVVCIYTYSDLADAIKVANSLDVHFQAAVFTRDLDVAMDSVRKLNATAVMVNDHTAFRADWMPFGGRDSSGAGMGGIPYSIHEMTRIKLMVITSPAL